MKREICAVNLIVVTLFAFLSRPGTGELAAAARSPRRSLARRAAFAALRDPVIRNLRGPRENGSFARAPYV